MLKVKLVPMTLLVPVIDNSGDHDMKMTQDAYDMAVVGINQIRSAVPQNVTETVPQGVSQNAVFLPEIDTRVLHPSQVSLMPTNRPGVWVKPEPPVSQIDPPIDTSVRDSEMRSTAPEMTLDELRERPERTKTPPRPRANSWRHD